MSSFNGDFISFHVRGYAKLLCFKDHARGILKIAKENDDCDDGLETVGGTINAQCKNVKIDTENYDTHIYRPASRNGICVRHTSITFIVFHQSTLYTLLS